MILAGKYKVDIKQDGKVVRSYETPNMIVNNGLQQVVNWLVFNAFSDGFYPGIKQIDTTGMTVTNAGFTNPQNAIDGSDATYTNCNVDSTSWTNDWWKIDLGESKNIIAVYWDCYEDDSSNGGDYKLEYSANDSDWYDFPTRLRPPQDATRSKCLFYVNESPPFTVQAARYIRLNTRRYNDNDNFFLYQLKFYEPNFIPQPPMIMSLGTGQGATTASQNALQVSSLSKEVSNITEPGGYVARFIMSLDTTEGNSTTFAEAGMFYNNSDNYSLQTTGNATTMFSRGLFDTPWSKTASETADVYYEISVSDVPYESSSSSSSSSSS